MSDRHLNAQHDEVRERNRQRREAQMHDAARLSAERNCRHGR